MNAVALLYGQTQTRPAPISTKLHGDGLSLAQIAAALTADGYKTRTGKKWNKVQVARVIKSAE